MGRENFVLKLSEVKTNEAVYVNPSHITVISVIKEGTKIETTAGEVVVKENIEQIQRKGGAYAIFKIVE